MPIETAFKYLGVTEKEEKDALLAQLSAS